MIQPLNTTIMKILGEYIEDLLGEKYTNWHTFISWDGQIIDMDESELLLLTRLQASKHKDGFIHHIRTEDMII